MFLEIRFGILTGRYAPGQIIPKDEICRVYDCRPKTAAEVLGALVTEGYLSRHKRGELLVRVWSRGEIEDLFDLRASLEGLAAARAAERASAAQIAYLRSLTDQAMEASPHGPQSLERVTLDNLRFHIEVMQMSRVPQIAEMARLVIPNALHRRIAWSQRSEDAENSAYMHRKIAAAIADRSAPMARLLMREDIYSSRESVFASIEALGTGDGSEIANIARLEPTFEVDGRIYGQGTREAAADGKIIPFGVPASARG